MFLKTLFYIRFDAIQDYNQFILLLELTMKQDNLTTLVLIGVIP